MSNKKWIPEIMYEESEEGGASSHIPFIMVPVNESMPNLLYIFESRDTGQTEPNLEGDEVPVYEWDLHQYADMLQLKNSLDQQTYDKVRMCLGLEPLNEAIQKGKKITSDVRKNLK